MRCILIPLPNVAKATIRRAYVWPPTQQKGREPPPAQQSCDAADHDLTPGEPAREALINDP